MNVATQAFVAILEQALLDAENQSPDFSGVQIETRGNDLIVQLDGEKTACRFCLS